jgi:hypothetical protein
MILTTERSIVPHFLPIVGLAKAPHNLETSISAIIEKRVLFVFGVKLFSWNRYVSQVYLPEPHRTLNMDGIYV